MEGMMQKIDEVVNYIKLNVTIIFSIYIISIYFSIFIIIIIIFVNCINEEKGSVISSFPCTSVDICFIVPYLFDVKGRLSAL